MENMNYLFAAFAIVWAMIFGYVFSLSRKQKQLQREIKSLEEKIEEKG